MEWLSFLVLRVCWEGGGWGISYLPSELAIEVISTKQFTTTQALQLR